MVVGKNSSNILYSCIRSAAHDIYVHLLLLSFCSFLTVGQTFAAANSYVSVESESGRVVCIGSDFLVIPDDPFLEEAVHVCVAAEVGWILSSSASLDIDSGLNAGWEVEGDSDNPEDSASGCIYVAKITLLSNTVDLLRANSTNVLFVVEPAFAKKHINFSVRPIVGEPLLRSQAKSGESPLTQDVTASVDSTAGYLSFQNVIDAGRKESGKDWAQFLFVAEDGSRTVTVNKKKDVNSLFGWISQDINESLADVFSPRRIARDWVKGILKDQVENYESLPFDMKEDYTSIFDKTAGIVSAIFPNDISSYDFISAYREVLKKDMIVDEGWQWNVELSAEVLFDGGVVSFSPKRNLSLYNWGQSVVQNNGFDSHMFSYKATKLGAKIEVNGHYAIGTCPVVYSFTFKASKQFEDIFELSFANSGDFSFSCFLGVIVKF